MAPVPYISQAMGPRSLQNCLGQGSIPWTGALGWVKGLLLITAASNPDRIYAVVVQWSERLILNQVTGVQFPATVLGGSVRRMHTWGEATGSSCGYSGDVSRLQRKPFPNKKTGASPATRIYAALV